MERRLFYISAILTICGSLIAGAVFGLMPGASFLAGGLLGLGSLAWLRHSVDSILFEDAKASKRRVLAGFVLRLVLIPLCLYVMIRFLFLSVPAAMAGFAVLQCSVFIEGVLEAFGKSPKRHARAK